MTIVKAKKDTDGKTEKKRKTKKKKKTPASKLNAHQCLEPITTSMVSHYFPTEMNRVNIFSTGVVNNFHLSIKAHLQRCSAGGLNV